MATFFNFDDSNFYIGKCNDMKENSSYYMTKERFNSSKSFTRKDFKDKSNNYILGNEYFEFSDK